MEDIAIIARNLRQIADMSLLNGTLTECSGLVNGKMGMAIFFFHYAEYTQNSLFADYAMEVIGEMISQIHVNSPADYEKGIAGIGVGIDYLIRNNFLNVEDDICEDFDERMVRAVMYDPWQDFSQYNGLTGYGRYWVTRLQYLGALVQARQCLLRIIALIEENLSDISIMEQSDVFCFLSDLQRLPGFEHCTGLLKKIQIEWNLKSSEILPSFFRLGNSTVGNIVRHFHHNRYLEGFLQDEFKLDLTPIPILSLDVAPTSMGLLNGYAGEGMLRLTSLKQINTAWMQLL